MSSASPTMELPTGAPSDEADWAPAAFAWLVWTIVTLSAFAFVAKYGSNVPYWDEWDSMVPYFVGSKPLSLHFLWEQHNEYRFPLPKLILIGLARLTHHDFRAGMYVSVAILAATAAGLMWGSRRLRGRTSYADAFFPLMLLHFGQYENLLMGSQICYVLPLLLGAVALLCIVLERQPLSLGQMAVGAVALTCLPLCGATGVPMTAVLILWLLYMVGRFWYSEQAHCKRDALIVLALAALPTLVLVAYFRHFYVPSWHPTSPGWKVTGQVTLECLSMSLGFGFCREFWPYSGLVLVLALGATVVALLVLGNRRLDERPRCLGMLLFVAATCALSAGVGWGRAGISSQAGFASRYLVFAMPLWWCFYFAWGLIPSRSGRGLAQMSLFALVCATFLMNTQVGWQEGRARRQAIQAFERDLNAGVPLETLLDRHGTVLYPVPATLGPKFCALHQKGIGPFANLNVAERQTLSLPLRPATVNQMIKQDHTWQGTGTDPYLVFRLDRPRQVDQVAVKYSLVRGGSPAHFQVYWTESARAGFVETERTARFDVPTGPEVRTLTIPVGDRIDLLRIDPDVQPCEFRLQEITLVTGANAAPVQSAQAP